MAVRGIDSDPIRNFKFRVDIIHTLERGYGNAMSRLGFMACSGLAASTEVISYREGGDNTTPRKMPGQTDFPPVSLTRGVVGAGQDKIMLWHWYREMFYVVQGGGNAPRGKDFRATVLIRAYDHPVTMTTAAGGAPFGEQGVQVTWKLYNAWPASIAFSDLDAGGNGVMVNNMTLMYEGFEVIV